MHDDQPRQLTQGLIDALVLTPVGPLDSAPQFIDIQITGLPGIRAQLRVPAARELQDALNILLGPKETPDLHPLLRRFFDVPYRSAEREELEDAVRKLVGAAPRKEPP